MAGRSRGPGSRPSGGPGPRRRQTSRSGRPAVRPRTANQPPAGQRARIDEWTRARTSGQRRPSLTGRAALLALVLGILVVSYAYPLRTWYDQHAERAALEAEAARLHESVADLEVEVELWQDSEFVQAQARRRLGYVLPGEVGYIVADESGVPEPEPGPDGTPVVAEGDWYSRLWTSLEAADALPPAQERE